MGQNYFNFSFFLIQWELNFIEHQNIILVPIDLNLAVFYPLIHDAVVVLTESMRAVAAMRHFFEPDGLQVLDDPVCLSNHL